MLEKVYDPAALEGKISGLWESSGGAGCRVASSKPPFSVLMPPEGNSCTAKTAPSVVV